MAGPFHARTVVLVPIVWRQDLRAAHASEQDTHLLSFRAKPAQPSDWFDDPTLFETVFLTYIRPARTSRRNEIRSADADSVIGSVVFRQSRKDQDTGKSWDAFVVGGITVNDAVYEDLWNRISNKVITPCEVRLSVVGFEVGPSPEGGHYWDVRKRPKLEVVGVEFHFSYDAPQSATV